MQKPLNTIFLGVSKKTQKLFYLTVLKELVKKFPILRIPCVGNFTLVEVGLSAGYKPENIYTSDISLYSTVIGGFITGKSTNDLPVKICEQWLPIYNALQTEEHRAAFMLWLIKVLQIREDVFYEESYLEYLTKNTGEVIEDLAAKMKGLAAKYHGIHYNLKDMRQDIEEDCSGSVTILHPPAYRGGYEKQFFFHGAMEWTPEFQNFDFEVEFETEYLKSKNKENQVFIWSAYNTSNGIGEKDIVFAEEVGKNKYEYYAITKPEELTSPIKYQVQFKKRDGIAPLPIKIIPKEYKITNTSKLEMISIKEENALYYRDLWAHKMGTTKAELYFMALIDGMAFGVTGIHLEKVRRLVSNDVFEVFGFDQPLDSHPNSHKLFMMMLTCMDFKRILENTSKVNRLAEIKGFRTVCITKYRKLKSSTGLLNIMSKEKLPNGMYKILYQTPFWKRSFNECLTYWIENEDISFGKEEEDAPEQQDG